MKNQTWGMKYEVVRRGEKVKTRQREESGRRGMRV